MSKLDLAPQENKLNQSLVSTHETFLRQEKIEYTNNLDLDLEALMEIFEEDQVHVEGCK